MRCRAFLSRTCGYRAGGPYRYRAGVTSSPDQTCCTQCPGAPGWHCGSLACAARNRVRWTPGQLVLGECWTGQPLGCPRWYCVLLLCHARRDLLCRARLSCPCCALISVTSSPDQTCCTQCPGAPGWHCGSLACAARNRVRWTPGQLVLGECWTGQPLGCPRWYCVLLLCHARRDLLCRARLSCPCCALIKIINQASSRRFRFTTSPVQDLRLYRLWCPRRRCRLWCPQRRCRLWCPRWRCRLWYPRWGSRLWCPRWRSRLWCPHRRGLLDFFFRRLGCGCLSVRRHYGLLQIRISLGWCRASGRRSSLRGGCSFRWQVSCKFAAWYSMVFIDKSQIAGC